MKVILLNGSPNAKGCTYTALEEVANTLNQEGVSTEIIHVGNKAIRGCIACRKCKTGGNAFLMTWLMRCHPNFRSVTVS